MGNTSSKGMRGGGAVVVKTLANDNALIYTSHTEIINAVFIVNCFCLLLSGIALAAIMDAALYNSTAIKIVNNIKPAFIIVVYFDGKSIIVPCYKIIQSCYFT